MAAAEPGPEGAPERAWYREWVASGFAGEMRYLTGHGAAARDDPRNLLASARSVVCVGKLYNTHWPYSTQFDAGERGWISRYAWGEDYHGVMRRGLERLDAMLRERAGAEYESKIAVDTAPLLERSYARMAGLGWIGKNTCLINQAGGSWFFLGELLVSLAIEPRRRGRPAARPLRDVHALHRRLPHRGHCAGRPGVHGGFPAVHFVPDHRAARRHGGGAPGGGGRARFRMRHLPGRMPVEPARRGDRRPGLRAAGTSHRRSKNWPP